MSKSDRCPCGDVILADSEDMGVPLCHDHYEEYRKHFEELKNLPAYLVPRCKRCRIDMIHVEGPWFECGACRRRVQASPVAR